ncbi:unnamed protein product [Closterium sp. NIES-54]
MNSTPLLTTLPSSVGCRYGFAELIASTATYLRARQDVWLWSSPFIGVTCDESMDRVRGKHQIVFATFLRDSRVVTEYIGLLTVEQCDGASLISLLLALLDSLGVDKSRVAGISTDGAGAMMGSTNGLMARLCVRVLHLFSSHCIAHRNGPQKQSRQRLPPQTHLPFSPRYPPFSRAHIMSCREALAAKDAATAIPKLGLIDTMLKELAEYLGRSHPSHNEFKELQEVFCHTNLELQ